MTPAQREVFLIIDEWWKMNGYGPSLQNIRDAVERPQSIASIQKKVKALIRLGICKGQKSRARSVRPSGLRVHQII
jgi:SOS-response transcriptional repressor LexA